MRGLVFYLCPANKVRKALMDMDKSVIKNGELWPKGFVIMVCEEINEMKESVCAGCMFSQKSCPPSQRTGCP